jgi:hypothetical protein
MDSKLLLLVHLAATWFLVGLIWTIQVVHYPLFAKVGAEGFAAYEASHSTLIGLVVMPLMLLELFTAFMLLAAPPAGIPTWVWWAGAALVGIIWLTTFFVSVPQHARLATGFDAQAHAILVSTNWIRTLAWTTRGLLVGWAVLRAM